MLEPVAGLWQEAWGHPASTDAPDHAEAKARFRYASLMDMYIIIGYGLASKLKAAAGVVVAAEESIAAGEWVAAGVMVAAEELDAAEVVVAAEEEVVVAAEMAAEGICPLLVLPQAAEAPRPGIKVADGASLSLWGFLGVPFSLEIASFRGDWAFKSKWFWSVLAVLVGGRSCVPSPSMGGPSPSPSPL